jgi:O-antigen/teichoic acid export membrane protein
MNNRKLPEQIRVGSEALFWKSLLTLAAFFLMWAGMLLTRTSPSWIETLSIALISLGALWLEFFCALTNGVNRLDFEVWLRIGYRGCVYGVGSLFALYGNLIAALIYMAAATVAVLTIVFVIFKNRVVPIRMIFRPIVGSTFLKESIPVWVTQLAQLTYLKFDVVILGLLHVAALYTGWYAAAWKIADVLTAVPMLMAAAALPLLSGVSPDKNVSLIAPRYLKVIYIIPILIALPLSLGAKWIIHLLYGDSFAGAPLILSILVWALVPIFVHSFLAVVAVATRRQAEAAKMAAVTSIVGILGAILLVPRVGYVAMAVVCLVANSIFACGMLYRFRNVTQSAQVVTGMKSLLSALAIYAFCLRFLFLTHPLLLSFGATVAYCFLMVCLGVVNLKHLSQSWGFFANILSKRPISGESVA